MKNTVLTGGYVSLDRIVKLEGGIEEGKTSLIQNKNNSEIFYGGCPVNISVALAKLGLAAAPLLRVGGDYEETGFADFLKQAGVNDNYIEVLPEEKTSNAFLLEFANGNHITLFYPGAQDEKFAHGLDDTVMEHVSMAVMTVGPRPDNEALLDACERFDVPLAFGMKCDANAFPTPFLRRILQYAEIIFMNASESTYICNALGLEKVEDLFKLGRVQTLVVTQGATGSEFWQKNGNTITQDFVKSCPPQNIVDTTGAGDAFMSGFLYAHLQGFEAATCCAYGSTLSSFVIETMGCTAGVPDREALEARYKENFYE